MRTQSATLGAGLGLIVPASVGLLLSSVPTVLSPFPTLTILPAFLLGQAYWLAVLVPMVLFFAWTPGLFRGQVLFPKRTVFLLGILTVLSVVYFVSSWRYGIDYQGWRFTFGMCLLNAAWLLLLWGMLLWRVGRSSFAANLLLHWLLFAWLAWHAFPYLGELP
jgi:hypothetical protein